MSREQLRCHACDFHDGVNVVGGNCEFCKWSPPARDPLKMHINRVANITVRTLNRFRELEAE